MARETDLFDKGRSYNWESRDYSRYAVPPRQERNPFRPLPPRQAPRQYRGQYRTVSR